jgi:hypothetical protein
MTTQWQHIGQPVEQIDFILENQLKGLYLMDGENGNTWRNHLYESHILVAKKLFNV